MYKLTENYIKILQIFGEVQNFLSDFYGTEEMPFHLLKTKYPRKVFTAQSINKLKTIFENKSLNLM